MPNDMYAEYLTAFKHHSSKYGAETAIFYQVGKFYEFYDWINAATGSTQTSLKRLVDILGVRLTIKKGDGPEKSDGLFAGVPEQSLHKYAAALTRAGWVVVVYEQTKDAKGSVVSRDVTRILTPGTHVEAVNDDGSSSASIAGVWLVGPAWGSNEPLQFACVSLDLTTGKSITHEGTAAGKHKPNSWTTDDIFHFFQVYLPKECIVWWKGSSVDQPSVGELQRNFGLPGIRIQILSGTDQGGFEIPMVREEFLQRTFTVQSLLPTREALRLTARPHTERAICSLFQRVQEHYPTGFKRLYWPTQWVPNTSLSLGNQALFQLNIVAPRMEDSVLGMFQKTYTAFGRRAMRQRILYPTADVCLLKRRYAEIQAILDLPGPTSETVQRNLRQIEDLPRLHRKISEGGITSAEILLLDTSYICSQRILEILENTPLRPSHSLNFEKLRAEFYQIFSIPKASTANENAFCFQDAAAPEVTKVEQEIQELYSVLETAVRIISKWAGLQDGLKIEYREVLAPIITGNKAPMLAIASALKGGHAPYPGMQLHQKKSSAHLEIPLFEQTYQKILCKRAELSRAIRTALPTLCGKFADTCLTIWDDLESWIATIDVSYTIATVSKERGFSCPTIDVAAAQDSYMDMEGLRHPLIEACMSRTEYVKHSVRLGGEASAGWLVYGMNASGKSSLMKAVGIALILAQSGCYVPASRFCYRPFHTLFTRILNTDNLWAGLSSFAVEMTELREILQRADASSLVLGDEVCSGTESVSATAIVGAALKWLNQRKSKFIFATHLHSLDTIVDEGISIWHLKVRYDSAADLLIYDRTLTPGPGSSLYGLEVARAMNLPEEVLAIAHTLRRELLGTKTEMAAPMSGWNSAIQRRECEICKTAFVKDLEVHHIRPRCEAVSGVFADGLQRDHVRNLVTVCSTCHDAHHAGTLQIAPLVQTSEGGIRLPKMEEADADTSVTKSLRKPKWTNEQIQQIQEYLRGHPTIPPKRAVFDLGERGIVITVPGLRAFRS